MQVAKLLAKTAYAATPPATPAGYSASQQYRHYHSAPSSAWETSRAEPAPRDGHRYQKEERAPHDREREPSNHGYRGSSSGGGGSRDHRGDRRDSERHRDRRERDGPDVPKRSRHDGEDTDYRARHGDRR
jgi:hypothetical protein